MHLQRRGLPFTVANDRFEQTREHALQLFASKGYHAVSMRELAASLGLTVGSLYNHVESKEALLLEFIEELYETLCVKAARVLGKSSRDARAQALIKMHLALHDSMPAHFILVEHDARHLCEEYRAIAARARGRYLSLLAHHCNLDIPSAGAALALLNSAPAWLFELTSEHGRRADLACQWLLGLVACRVVEPSNA